MNARILELLDRYPDPPHGSLKAWDATDTLLLDTAFPPGSTLEASRGAGAVIAVDGDRYGALTLSVAERFPEAEIRVYQDLVSGGLALRHNRGRVATVGVRLGTFTEYSTREEAYRGATHLMAQLPKAVVAVKELALVASRMAAPSAVMFAGVRLKYLVPAMTDALLLGFESVQAGLARQKSRVLRASGPVDSCGAESSGHSATDGRETPLFPLRARQSVVVAGEAVSLEVCAFGETFGGTQIDAGTALLLENIPEFAPGMRVHDLGCGNGSVAASLRLRFPEVEVTASDVSRSAVHSTIATLTANGIDTVPLEPVPIETGTPGENGSSSDSPGTPVRALVTPGLVGIVDKSCHAVVLNPPFHQGGRVDDKLAAELFAEAARVLAPGGTLYVVWNSHLRYRAQLERIVGKTTQLARNPQFTVTASTPVFG